MDDFEIGAGQPVAGGQGHVNSDPHIGSALSAPYSETGHVPGDRGRSSRDPHGRLAPVAPLSASDGGADDQNPCDAHRGHVIGQSSPVDGGADGQTHGDTQVTVAVSEPSPPRKLGRPRKAMELVSSIVPPPSVATHTAVPTDGGGGEDRAIGDASPNAAMPDFSPIIAKLIQLQTERRFLIKSQMRQNSATLALVRRYCGWSLDQTEKERKAAATRAQAIVKAIEASEPSDDPVTPLVMALVLTAATARGPFDAMREDVEKQMTKLVKQLPIWTDWGRGVKGLSEKWLGIIIGEAGDIGAYSNPAKLWKRLGLAVIDGRRQGNPGSRATAEDWIVHGYSKARRSEVWNVGQFVFRAQWRGERDDAPAHAIGPYGAVYAVKKSDYVARITATADLPEAERWTQGRAHNAALRYMTKRLIKHLWQAWRRDPLIDEGSI